MTVSLDWNEYFPIYIFLSKTYDNVTISSGACSKKYFRRKGFMFIHFYTYITRSLHNFNYIIIYFSLKSSIFFKTLVFRRYLIFF